MSTSKPIDENSREFAGWVTVPEFARIIRVTPSRAYQMVRNGELPVRRIGRRNFVAVTAWGRKVLETLKRLDDKGS